MSKFAMSDLGSPRPSRIAVLDPEMTDHDRRVNSQKEFA